MKAMQKMLGLTAAGVLTLTACSTDDTKSDAAAVDASESASEEPGTATRPSVPTWGAHVKEKVSDPTAMSSAYSEGRSTCTNFEPLFSMFGEREIIGWKLDCHSETVLVRYNDYRELGSEEYLEPQEQLVQGVTLSGIDAPPLEDVNYGDHRLTMDVHHGGYDIEVTYILTPYEKSAE